MKFVFDSFSYHSLAPYYRWLIPLQYLPFLTGLLLLFSIRIRSYTEIMNSLVVEETANLR